MYVFTSLHIRFVNTCEFDRTQIHKSENSSPLNVLPVSAQWHRMCVHN
jgi:hypothetical protein